MLGREFFTETRLGRTLVFCAAGGVAMEMAACGAGHVLTDNPTRWRVGTGTELYLDDETTRACGAVTERGAGVYDSSKSYSQTGVTTDAVQLNKLPPNDGGNQCPAQPWLSLNDLHIVQIT